MQIVLVGPGRAGTSVALAAVSAGHDVVAVAARRPEAASNAAARLGAATVAVGEQLPVADLAIVAVVDDAIPAVAEMVAPGAVACRAAVHLSGLAPVSTLDPFRRRGVATGSFHPLQSLPTADAGAAALAGSWVGITTHDAGLAGELERFGRDLGLRPFPLDDDAKATYHAGAAAAANFPLAALTMAADLFDAANVPWEAARPLAETIVRNAFELGPRVALTGPVVRGDVATVRGQLDAVARSAPEWIEPFTMFVRALADLTGRSEAFAELVTHWQPPEE